MFTDRKLQIAPAWVHFVDAGGGDAVGGNIGCDGGVCGGGGGGGDGGGFCFYFDSIMLYKQVQLRLCKLGSGTVF